MLLEIYIIVEKSPKVSLLASVAGSSMRNWPSKIPPLWFGWLHHTLEAPPTKVTQLPYFWEKPHQPNLTGTPRAHQPVLKGEGGADYTAWSPGSLRGP